MEGSYNARCPAVKRLLREAHELHQATEEYFAQPLDDNLFEWHFTVRGPPETEFEGGVYHGRIIMPAEYPMKPPNIIFFTPNGRFETNKKICLSISGHHPETWQPSWSIRTALLAIIGFMPTPANGTIGALDYTAAERTALSKKSVDFECCNCGRVENLLKERTGKNDEIQKEAREVSSQMSVSTKRENSEDNLPSLVESESIKTENSTEVEKYNSKQQENVTDTSITESPSVNIPNQQATHVVSHNVPVLTAATQERVAIHPGLRNIPTSVASSQSPSSLSIIANNILISAAFLLLIALVLRRLFLIESETSDEMEEILL